MKIEEIESSSVVRKMANRAVATAKLNQEKIKQRLSKTKNQDKIRKLQKAQRDATLTDDVNDSEAKEIQNQKDEINAEECGAILDV